MEPQFLSRASERFAFDVFPQLCIDLGFHASTCSELTAAEMIAHASRNAEMRLRMAAEGVDILRTCSKTLTE